MALGADEAFEAGARLPERVDAVMESVGEATWSHSLKSLRPGGRVVVCGSTSGPNPPADLARVFFLQLSVIGSTMGTRDELEQLLAFCAEHSLDPAGRPHLPARRGGPGHRTSGVRRELRQDRRHRLTPHWLVYAQWWRSWCRTSR